MNQNEFHNRRPTIIRQLLFSGLIIFGSFLKASAQEYFQQRVNYNIQVTLNDKLHELNAFETVNYTNNSPDTLRFLYFHLWPNGYSNNNTELAKQLFNIQGKQKLFNDPELKGYMDSLDFRIDNRKLRWNLLAGQPDICQVSLNKPLLPRDSIQITTPFMSKFPRE